MSLFDVMWVKKTKEVLILPNVRIQHIDTFSAIPEKGNPAGVVLNGKDFSDTQMQAIAAAVGFNETALSYLQ